MVTFAHLGHFLSYLKGPLNSWKYELKTSYHIEPTY